MGTPDPLAPLRDLVEAGLRDLDLGVPDDLPGFAEAVRYPLLAGGKRIRPVLCLATGSALGLPAERLLPTALALELVHTFSLVHDDLPAMDDDDLRRGLPTTHRRYGEDVAILVGDALLTSAFELVAGQDGAAAELRLAVLARLARATGSAGMIGGQYLDVRAPEAIDEAGLQRLHRMKTGALLEASVGCAVVLAGPPPAVADALGSFAATLGLLFQIVDDVLDATGSDASLGKTAGKDARQGRRTYVSALGLDGARDRAERCEATARAELARVPGDTTALGAVLDLVARRRS
jgi:geranylgeranyl diphosphate synthase type II